MSSNQMYTIKYCGVVNGSIGILSRKLNIPNYNQTVTQDSEENNPDENEYSAETYTVNDHEALSNKIKEFMDKDLMFQTSKLLFETNIKGTQCSNLTLQNKNSIQKDNNNENNFNYAKYYYPVNIVDTKIQITEEKNAKMLNNSFKHYMKYNNPNTIKSINKRKSMSCDVSSRCLPDSPKTEFKIPNISPDRMNPNLFDRDFKLNIKTTPKKLNIVSITTEQDSLSPLKPLRSVKNRASSQLSIYDPEQSEVTFKESVATPSKFSIHKFSYPSSLPQIYNSKSKSRKVENNYSATTEDYELSAINIKSNVINQRKIEEMMAKAIKNHHKIHGIILNNNEQNSIIKERSDSVDSSAIFSNKTINAVTNIPALNIEGFNKYSVGPSSNDSPSKETANNTPVSQMIIKDPIDEGKLEDTNKKTRRPIALSINKHINKE